MSKFVRRLFGGGAEMWLRVAAVIVGMWLGTADSAAALRVGSCAPGIDNCGFAASCTQWCYPYACTSQQCGTQTGTLKCWKCQPAPEQ